MSKPGILVHGPAGSGKSQVAKLLAIHFDLICINDEWEPGQPIPNNTLCLTNAAPPRVMSIDTALAILQKASSP